ncbi:MAG: TAXI family TRAP transporter solute-binding subunit [Eubacteriales bacterium]
MKKLAILLSATMLVTALAGCGSTSKSTTINFPTASTTGTVYPLGSAIANLWNTEIDNMKASAQASNGGVDNLNLIADGEAQMGVAVTSILYENYHGEGSFEGRANEDLRVLAGLYYNPNQLVVAENSGIESIGDLVGKSFAPGASGSTGEVETNVHLTSYGLTYPDDIQAQFVGFTEATDLIRNKQLDGAWIMAGVPTAAVTEVTATAGGKVISIDEELIEALQALYPWYAKYTIPAGTYEGQDEDVLTSAVKITICTDASVDDDAVYEMTKVLWENIETLKATNPALEGLTVADAVTDLAGVPIHDGAAKYYREVGVLD